MFIQNHVRTEFTHTVKEAFQGVKATCDTALKTGNMGIFKKREVTCLRC